MCAVRRTAQAEFGSGAAQQVPVVNRFISTVKGALLLVPLSLADGRHVAPRIRDALIRLRIAAPTLPVCESRCVHLSPASTTWFLDAGTSVTRGPSLTRHHARALKALCAVVLLLHRFWAAGVSLAGPAPAPQPLASCAARQHRLRPPRRASSAPSYDHAAPFVGVSSKHLWLPRVGGLGAGNHRQLGRPGQSPDGPLSYRPPPLATDLWFCFPLAGGGLHSRPCQFAQLLSAPAHLRWVQAAAVAPCFSRFRSSRSARQCNVPLPLAPLSAQFLQQIC